MPAVITHAANVASGLIRPHRDGGRTQTDGGLADPLEAALDGVAHHVVGGKRVAIDAGEIPADPIGIIDDVG